ncbi:MAG: thioredoxin-dependent thiol peroxidase [Pyrinomonadaceae bacterium]
MAALKEGMKAPEFKLTADDDSTVKLKDFKGQTVILFFYPKANTSGCTIEACDFRDAKPAFAKKGAVILGISPDPVKNLVKFREAQGLTYPLLADEDHAVAVGYGVWGEKSLYGRKYMGVERTTFVIGPDGKIAKVYPKVKVREHAQAVLSDL